MLQSETLLVGLLLLVPALATVKVLDLALGLPSVPCLLVDFQSLGGMQFTTAIWWLGFLPLMNIL